jgi:hypothetical protein
MKINKKRISSGVLFFLLFITFIPMIGIYFLFEKVENNSYSSSSSNKKINRKITTIYHIDDLFNPFDVDFVKVNGIDISKKLLKEED